MTSKKTLKAAMIDRLGRTWNTRPERQFDDYQRSRGLGLVQNVILPFVSENRVGRLQRWDFQLDFARPLDAGGYDVDFEVDGQGHNDHNDFWKDNVKNQRGLKVIHIPGILTGKKWWPYLDSQLPKALLSASPTVYVIA